MPKYKIELWSEPEIIIEKDNIDRVIQYLYENEKDRIYKIMNTNGELILFKKGSTTILWNNEYGGSLWFDLDTNNVLDNLEKELKTLEKLNIDNLSYKQFNNLILLMWNELCDDYGGSYICISEEN